METGKLKLALSAGALALSMALAGCGGSSSSGGTTTPATTTTSGTERPLNCTDGQVAYNGSCIPRLTAAQCPANGVNSAGNACNPAPAEPAKTPFEMAGGTPGTLLDSEGDLSQASVRATDSDYATAVKDKLLIPDLYGSVNPGMKWHEILKATDIPLGGGTGKAVKVTGKRSDWIATAISGATEDAVTTGAEYKGFSGSLICTGTDCNTPATADAEFAGSWYFYVVDDSTTTDDIETTADWVKNPDEDDEYVLRSEQPHADWGVWLTDRLATSDQPGKLIRYYWNAGPAPGGDWNADKSASGASNTATYKGDAVGVSTLYKSGDDEATVGSFTATAELTATFLQEGVTTASLKGKITEFQGNAVNTGWELELLSSNLQTSGRLVAADADNRNTRANRSIALNTWDAQLYGTGTDNDRPVGVVGDFDGRFRDGQAVGVFHAD